MDIVLKRGTQADLFEKIRNIAELCKISNIEKYISESFEKVPNSSALKYIGEFNKSDVML